MEEGHLSKGGFCQEGHQGEVGQQVDRESVAPRN